MLFLLYVAAVAAISLLVGGLAWAAWCWRLRLDVREREAARASAEAKMAAFRGCERTLLTW